MENAAKKEVAPNYSKEQEAHLVALAENGPITFAICEQLGVQWNKKPRSIVGKVKQLELAYESKPAPVKKADNAPTKAMMVQNIANLLNVNVDSLKDLDKTSVAGLTVLTKAIIAVAEQDDSEQDDSE